MRVEVVFVAPGGVDLTELDIEDGTTAAQAVRLSGLLERHPGISKIPLTLGIFSRAVRAEAVLREGDRVEVYRPLNLPAGELRRLRAKAKPRRARAAS